MIESINLFHIIKRNVYFKIKSIIIINIWWKASMSKVQGIQKQNRQKLLEITTLFEDLKSRQIFKVVSQSHGQQIAFKLQSCYNGIINALALNMRKNQQLQLLLENTNTLNSEKLKEKQKEMRELKANRSKQIEHHNRIINIKNDQISSLTERFRNQLEERNGQIRIQMESLIQGFTHIIDQKQQQINDSKSQIESLKLILDDSVDQKGKLKNELQFCQQKFSRSTSQTSMFQVQLAQLRKSMSQNDVQNQKRLKHYHKSFNDLREEIKYYDQRGIQFKECLIKRIVSYQMATNKLQEEIRYILTEITKIKLGRRKKKEESVSSE